MMPNTKQELAVAVGFGFGNDYMIPMMDKWIDYLSKPSSDP